MIPRCLICLTDQEPTSPPPPNHNTTSHTTWYVSTVVLKASLRYAQIFISLSTTVEMGGITFITQPCLFILSASTHIISKIYLETVHFTAPPLLSCLSSSHFLFPRPLHILSFWLHCNAGLISSPQGSLSPI